MGVKQNNSRKVGNTANAEEGKVHLGFALDELRSVGSTSCDIDKAIVKVQEAMSAIADYKEWASLKVDSTPETAGHLGYTSEDGDDFENQEVDRMLEE